MDFMQLKHRCYIGIARRESPCKLVPLQDYNQCLHHINDYLAGTVTTRFVVLAEDGTGAVDCHWLGNQLETILDELIDQLGISLIELFPAIKRNAASMLERFLTDEQLKFCAVLNVSREGKQLSGGADWSSLRISAPASMIRSVETQRLIKQQVAMLVLNRLAGWMPDKLGALSQEIISYEDRKVAFKQRRQLPLWFVRGVSSWLAGMEGDGLQQISDTLASNNVLDINHSGHNVQDYATFIGVMRWLCTPCGEGGAGNTAQDIANLLRACNSTASLYVLESMLGVGQGAFSFYGLPESISKASASRSLN